jgi:hypothetical protein
MIALFTQPAGGDMRLNLSQKYPTTFAGGCAFAVTVFFGIVAYKAGVSRFAHIILAAERFRHVEQDYDRDYRWGHP